MFWRKTLLALCLGAVVGNVWAKEAKIYKPSPRYEWSEQELAAERARRLAILDRTQNVMSLLAAEIALNQGDMSSAMGFYLATLRETKDPDVAERAMELAINARAYAVAEYFYQEWRKIEPQPSVAQRRLAFTRALALGDGTIAMPQVKSVLAEANENQRRRLFLQLAQMSVVHEDLLRKGGRVVHEAAAAYPELAEARIADVLYSSGSGQEKHAIAALQQLADLDKELTPQSQLTLEVLAQQNPELFKRFFAQNSQKLPSAWQQLHLSALIQTGQFAQANEVIQHLLGENPDASLYIQAALLTNKMNQDDAVVFGHLEKAYHSGTNEQKSRAALLAAMRLAELKRLTEAKKWIERVDAPEFALDKNVFLANLASEDKQWQQALKYLAQAEKLPKESSLIFNQKDVQRIKLYAQSQLQTPSQAIVSLTAALKKARAMPDGDDKRETISQILYQRGLIYADKLRQSERAVVDLREFVALNPDNPTGFNALGYTLLSLPSEQNLKEAFDLIQAAYQKDSENPQINDSLGWAYHKKGDNASALPYLEFAFQQEPVAEVAAHLGEVYWLLGRQEDAKRVWQKGWQDEAKQPVLQDTLKRYGIVF